MGRSNTRTRNYANFSQLDLLPSATTTNLHIYFLNKDTMLVFLLHEILHKYAMSRIGRALQKLEIEVMPGFDPKVIKKEPMPSALL